MEPKTRQSRRTIALPAVVVDALQHHKAKKSQERLLAGTRWHETGLVFTSTIGTPIEVGNLRRHFWKLLEKAGLPRMRFHDLRHSCASLLLVQGAPARVVWRRLDTRTSASRWTPIRTSCLSSSVRLQMRWIGPWALGPWRGECRDEPIVGRHRRRSPIGKLPSRCYGYSRCKPPPVVQGFLS